jgi:dihydrofolate synthase/folylpolyglutamate synthase
MNITEEENWVMSRRNPGHGLAPLRKACAAVGNPQDQIHTIHVAGTNGKGSTCSYLASILQGHGYKVGLFTSPHLTDHRDRIRINGKWISKEDFHHYLSKDMDLILENDLGMFEIDCLIAFEWFYDERVDYAVIECGLGGRLDNTNILKHPDLEIITSVAMDHMNILGHRLSQIANEKAGIFQPYGTALIGKLNPSVLSVIERKAWRTHTALHRLHPFMHVNRKMVRFANDLYDTGSCALYQAHNCALALQAAEILGIDIHDPCTHVSVKQSRWPGRFELVQRHPDVILDGAHNKEGMEALLASLQDIPSPLTIVYSALKDKPARYMAEHYQARADRLIVTSFANARADSLEDLSVEGAEVIEDWQKAVSTAVRECPENGTVVITGSLYFISLARSYFLPRVNTN